MRRPSLAALAAAFALALCSATPARPAWITDGTPLWPGHATNYFPVIAGDEVGGFIVCPIQPGDTAFFRFNPDGALAGGWPWLRPTGLGSATITSLSPDGVGGGYFAAAINVPQPSPGVTLYRLNGDGSYHPAFGPGGIELDSGTDRRYATTGPDGDGGAMVTWSKSANTAIGKEVWGTRVTAAGLLVPGWPPGGTFITGALDSEFIAIAPPVPDGAGGFFQYIEGVIFGLFGQTRRPRLLHYDGIGQPIAGWPPEGFSPPGLPANGGLSYVADGGGGAYLSWRVGTVARLLHLTPSGGAWAGWPAEGLEPCPDPSLACYAAGLLPDGGGGVWFALERQLISPSDPLHLNLLRFGASGGPPAGWAPGGMLLPVSSSTGLSLALAHGPGGACMLLYGDYANDGAFGFYVASLHAARVEPDGGLFTLGHWGAGEIAVCGAPGARYDAQLLDAPGGATFALWRDSRGAPAGSASLYAMRIAPDGGTNVGVPMQVPADRTISVTPNPARAISEVRFATSARAISEVSVFDVAGRRLRTLVSGTLEAGDHVLPWDGRDEAGRLARPGVYLVRARLGAHTLEARLVRVE